MFLFLAIILLGIEFRTLDLHNFSATLSQPFHAECLSSVPTSSWSELYAATVCGKNLQNSEMSFYLKKFGLLHMIVVSGAHLLFLEKLIITLGLRAKIFVYPLMILFCLVTSLQAPVLRALVAIFLNDVNDRFHLFWRPVQITWLSGIFLWLLFPDWIHSFSFLLSWACALALALMAGQSAFKKQLFLYLFLGLFLLPLQTSHPISILLNLLFAPLIGFLLFPTSLFAFFIPAFTQIPDTLWAVLFRILEWLHQGVESVSLQYPISLLTLWAVLWLTHLLLEIWRQPR